MGSGAGEKLEVGAEVRPLLAVLDTFHTLIEGIDPAQAAARDALDLVVVLDRFERLAAAGKAMAATRVAESNLWKQAGHSSPADHMAALTGVGVHDAVGLLKTGAAVADAPETRDALTSGRVSRRQADAIARVEMVSPGKARDLLARASDVSAKELESEANRIVAAGSTETDAEKIERHRKARRLSTWIDADAMGCGQWRLPPAEHARLLAQLDSARNDIFTAARENGVRESSGAYAADALMSIVGRAEKTRGTAAAVGADASTDGDPTAAGDSGAEPDGEDWSFAKVIVRVDATALDRGELAPGEMCEIAGQGPIPVADAWRTIDGGAFVAAIATRGTDIDKLVHLGRRPTALQRTALEWLTAGECSAEGCTSKARLEIDHIADWADTHRTELSQITGPCGKHHDLKTHHGWTWGPLLPNGKRRLIPPDDARAGPATARTRPEPPEHPTPISEAPVDWDQRVDRPVAAPPDAHARAGPGPGPTPITDAPSVTERAQALATRARAGAPHPSSRRSATRAAPGQDGLFDTG